MATAKTNTTKTATPTKKEKVVEIKKLHRQEKYDYKNENDELVQSYTFQFPGTREAERIITAYAADPVKGRNDYHDELMEHVIVEPAGVDYDYFDEHAGYTEVIAAADHFLAAVHYDQPYYGQGTGGEELE